MLRLQDITALDFLVWTCWLLSLAGMWHLPDRSFSFFSSFTELRFQSDWSTSIQSCHWSLSQRTTHGRCEDVDPIFTVCILASTLTASSSMQSSLTCVAYAAKPKSYHGGFCILATGSWDGATRISDQVPMTGTCPTFFPTLCIRLGKKDLCSPRANKASVLTLSSFCLRYSCCNIGRFFIVSFREVVPNTSWHSCNDWKELAKWLKLKVMHSRGHSLQLYLNNKSFFFCYSATTRVNAPLI